MSQRKNATVQKAYFCVVCAAEIGVKNGRIVLDAAHSSVLDLAD